MQKNRSKLYSSTGLSASFDDYPTKNNTIFPFAFHSFSFVKIRGFSQYFYICRFPRFIYFPVFSFTTAPSSKNNTIFPFAFHSFSFVKIRGFSQYFYICRFPRFIYFPVFSFTTAPSSTTRFPLKKTLSTSP